MSDTPRTDAEPTYKTGIARTRTVNIDFARQLERELAEAKMEAERYRWLRDNSYNVQIGLERELAAAIEQHDKAVAVLKTIRKCLVEGAVTLSEKTMAARIDIQIDNLMQECGK